MFNKMPVAVILLAFAVATYAEITPNLIVYEVGALQATGEEYVTYRLVTAVSGSDDWTSAQLTATVTDSTFYQDFNGDGNPPDPAGFGAYPDSEVTSYYTSPDDYPNAAYSGGVVGFNGGPTETATALSADWFDVVSTGDGIFVVAQITVLPSAPSWSGQIDLTAYSTNSPGGVVGSWSISAADYGPPVTATYIGPSPGTYNNSGHWDLGVVPLNSGTDRYNVIIPNGVSVDCDVPGGSQISGLSLGSGSTFDFVAGESLLVGSTAVISGTIDAFGSGAAFLAPSQFATFSDHPMVFVSKGATVAIAAPSYSYSSGINSSFDILSAYGSAAVLNLSSLDSISVPLCVGYGTARTYTISADSNGFVDLSGVTSVTGASTSTDGYCGDWLRFLVAADGDIDLQSLSQVDGRTWFDIDVATYGLPALESASTAHFDLTDGQTFNVPVLSSFDAGTFDVPASAIIDAPQLASFTTSTMLIADGGTVSTPSLTNISGSVVDLNPSRTLIAPPFTSIDNARLSLAGGATLTVAASSYACNPGINSDLTILSADGVGTYLDMVSLSSVSVPICVGYGVARTYSIAATNSGFIDLSGLGTASGASTSTNAYCGDWLRFLVASNGDIDLQSLWQANGRIWFDIDVPAYSLPALQESIDTIALDLDLGTLLSAPALQRILGTGNSLTVPVFATLDAPVLTEINGTTVNLDVGGTIEAPNLTTFTNSILTLSPGRVLNAPPFSNVDHSRIFIEGGGALSVVATSYTYDTGINADLTILSADGADSLLDMSSVVSVTAPLCVGYGTTRTYTIVATNNAVVDLSGLTQAAGASLSGNAYCGDWLQFTTDTGGRIRFGDLTVSGGRTQFVIDGTSSNLDFDGGLNLQAPSQLIATLAATVTLSGDFSFDHTTESDLDTGDGIFWMNGAATQVMEVGGEDIGVPVGPVSGNFKIGQLIVGQSAQANIVRLVDDVDNGNRGGSGIEALYLQGFSGSDNGLRILGGSILVIENIQVYVSESDEWVHINSLFPPGQNQIAYDQGFISLSLVASDCNTSGIDDRVDILLGNSTDCNSNGLPDECEIDVNSPAPGGPFFCVENCDPDCNINGIPDGCDIAGGTSQDCNENAVPDACDIAGATSNDINGDTVPDECEDCNNNGIQDWQDMTDCAGGAWCDDCNATGILDVCDIAAVTSPDLNVNGIPDECEADCNSNAIPDDWDISSGTSTNCNANGVPDECDIANGTSNDINGNATPDECETDCQPNGVPDDWDISTGASPDCNSNGVPDECEVAGGTSNDVNGNGIPDECETDCQPNSVPDDWDISSGASPDCNENSVPDECDIAGGTSLDTDGNQIPDECEDCNTNGVLDYLDVANGTSEDCNGNVLPDECEVGLGMFQWIGLDGGSFTEPANWDPAGVPGGEAALINTSDVDNTCILGGSGSRKICRLTVEATDGWLQTLQIDGGSTLRSTGGTAINTNGQIMLTGGTLDDGDLFAGEVVNAGRLFGHGTVAAPLNNTSTVETSGGELVLTGDNFANQADGILRATTGRLVDVRSPSVTQEGRLEILATASMLFAQPLVNQPGGSISLFGGSLGADALNNAAGATIDGFGTIEADVDNDGSATFIADSQIVGDLVNDGTITIQNGTLTVVGVLTNNGIIIGNSARAGDRAEPRTAGDGLFALDGYVASANASLFLTPTSALRTGGDFDVAVADNMLFNMAEAALHMIGSGAVQTLELMSTDIGPDPAGLDRAQPGHYPIGKLHIAAPSTVEAVDVHDNDGLGQGTCEVLYVNVLEIDAGATLNNPSCRIYYGTLTNYGTVSHPQNLIQLLPSCGADIDGDGDVDAQDYAGLAACLAGPTGGLLEVTCMCFDFDDSGAVDLADFAAFQRAFTGP